MVDSNAWSLLRSPSTTHKSPSCILVLDSWPVAAQDGPSMLVLSEPQNARPALGCVRLRNMVRLSKISPDLTVDWPGTVVLPDPCAGGQVVVALGQAPGRNGFGSWLVLLNRLGHEAEPQPGQKTQGGGAGAVRARRHHHITATLQQPRRLQACQAYCRICIRIASRYSSALSTISVSPHCVTCCTTQTRIELPSPSCWSQQIALSPFRPQHTNLSA